jgi:hypothetical protein
MIRALIEENILPKRSQQDPSSSHERERERCYRTSRETRPDAYHGRHQRGQPYLLTTWTAVRKVERESDDN